MIYSKISALGIDFIMKLRPVTYQLDITGLDNKLNTNRSQVMNAVSQAAVTEKENSK